MAQNLPNRILLACLEAYIFNFKARILNEKRLLLDWDWNPLPPEQQSYLLTM